MTAKKLVAGDPFDGAVEVPVDELEPVELDPPAPEIARWQELADRGIDKTQIYHAGDASAVMPIPRPPWADEDSDLVGRSLLISAYKSRSVSIPIHKSAGKNKDGFWYSACVHVSAKLFAYDSEPVIPITLSSVGAAGTWETKTENLTLEAARELADVLRAAVDLIGEGDG